MKTLVVGDHFAPASYYLEAFRTTLSCGFGPVRAVDWAGSARLVALAIAEPANTCRCVAAVGAGKLGW